MKRKPGCQHEPWCPDAAGFVIVVGGKLQQRAYCRRHANANGGGRGRRLFTIKEARIRLGNEAVDAIVFPEPPPKPKHRGPVARSLLGQR